MFVRLSGFVLTISLVATTIVAQQDNVVLRSKLDDKVLTVMSAKVPPTGPYQRFGVAALDLNSTLGLPQNWAIDEELGGQIFSHGGSWLNSLSTGLPCDDCFTYTYFYNFSSPTSDGYQLFQREILWDEGVLCVSNPGGEGYITDKTCDEKDASQLWRVEQA